MAHGNKIWLTKHAHGPRDIYTTRRSSWARISFPSNDFPFIHPLERWKRYFGVLPLFWEKIARSRMNQNTKSTRTLLLILTLSRLFKLSIAIWVCIDRISCLFSIKSNCDHRSLLHQCDKDKTPTCNRVWIWSRLESMHARKAGITH